MQQDPQTNIPADGSESRQKNQLVREVAEKNMNTVLLPMCIPKS